MFLFLETGVAEQIMTLFQLHTGNQLFVWFRSAWFVFICDFSWLACIYMQLINFTFFLPHSVFPLFLFITLPSLLLHLIFLYISLTNSSNLSSLFSSLLPSPFHLSQYSTFITLFPAYSFQIIRLSMSSLPLFSIWIHFHFYSNTNLFQIADN